MDICFICHDEDGVVVEKKEIAANIVCEESYWKRFKKGYYDRKYGNGWWHNHHHKYTKNDKCNSVSCVSDSDKVLRIAVLLPGDVTDNELHITSIEYQNRLKQILPGIEVISGLNKNPLENMNNNNGMQLYQSNLSKILPGWKIEVITGETKCSPTDGILESFRLQCQAG